MSLFNEYLRKRVNALNQDQIRNEISKRTLNFLTPGPSLEERKGWFESLLVGEKLATNLDVPFTWISTQYLGDYRVSTAQSNFLIKSLKGSTSIWSSPDGKYMLCLGLFKRNDNPTFEFQIWMVKKEDRSWTKFNVKREIAKPLIHEAELMNCVIPPLITDCKKGVVILLIRTNGIKAVLFNPLKPEIEPITTFLGLNEPKFDVCVSKSKAYFYLKEVDKSFHTLLILNLETLDWIPPSPSTGSFVRDLPFSPSASKISYNGQLISFNTQAEVMYLVDFESLSCQTLQLKYDEKKINLRDFNITIETTFLFDDKLFLFEVYTNNLMYIDLNTGILKMVETIGKKPIFSPDSNQKNNVLCLQTIEKKCHLIYLDYNGFTTLRLERGVLAGESILEAGTKGILEGGSKIVKSLKIKSLTSLIQNLRRQPPDLKVELMDGEIISTHSLILAGRSDFFSSLINGPFQEASEKKISFPDVTLADFTNLLCYFHEEDNFLLKLDTTEKLDLFELAGRFLIEELQAQILDSFFETFIKDDSDCLIVAKTYLDSCLPSLSPKYYFNFKMVISENEKILENPLETSLLRVYCRLTDPK